MSTKSSQLQIRVSPQEKARLKMLATRSGLGVSEYVLGKVFPARSSRFREILLALGNDADSRFVLADLNDFLSDLGAGELC